jgi:hypothetical protein
VKIYEKMRAFRDIGDTFGTFVDNIRANIRLKLNPPDEREEYIKKFSILLAQLTNLTDNEINAIGYIPNKYNSYTSHIICFKTNNYSITSGRDLNYNSDYSKHDFQVLDSEGKSVLKKSTIYCPHDRQTDLEYQSSPDWKVEAIFLLKQIEKNIINAKKLSAVSNMKEETATNLSKNNLKPR